MKAKKLMLKNVGIISETEINIDKPLILFYGEVKQGKTTILNAIRWLAGGKAVNIPKNLITIGKSEANITLILENGRISRTFKLKSGELKAERIDAVINNIALTQEHVTKLFNPFLIDQNHFLKMNTIDKNKFLLETLGVDTSELDSEYRKIESENREKRIEIKAYGEIDTTPVESPNIEELNKTKAEILNKNSEIQKEYRKKIEEENERVARENTKITDHNLNYTALKSSIEGLNQDIKILQEQLTEKQDALKKAELLVSLEENKPKELLKPNDITYSELLSTEEIDEKISNAKADELRYNSYLENLEKQKQKDEKTTSLLTAESRQREIKAEKAKLLQQASNKIEQLTFDETGYFYFENTPSDMLSDSQMIRLSSKLSSLFSEGLSIELIDKGESLGKSVFDLVDEAKEKERNILVSVVGNEPAEVQEDIGVFVVDNGNVTVK